MSLLMELEAKERDLLHELDKVRSAINVEKLKNIKQEYGLSVGSLVTLDRLDRSGDVYRVEKIRTEYSGKPWVYGCRRNKDGSFTARETNLFDDWKLVEPTRRIRHGKA